MIWSSGPALCGKLKEPRTGSAQAFARTALFLCLLHFAGLSQAQSGQPGYKEYFMEGSYLLLEDEIDKARENFEIAYKLDSSSANINYMLGICYMESSSHKEKAERYLAKATQNISTSYKSDDAAEKAAPPLALYYYGRALHVNYKFDEAQKQFEAFRKHVDPKDNEYVKMLNKEVNTTKLAKETINFPVNVKITNLGDSINSEYPEYSPVFSADERMLIYTTRRPSTTGGMKSYDGLYFEDLVVSYKDDNGRWSKPVNISPNINSIGPEASINLSPDGQTLIVFRNDPSPKNNDGDGNIFFSTFNGKDWSPLQEFATNVNTPYWESHACLSANGNLLFFASERPGGYGGKDIYRCVKLPNGQWSKALNMGPVINTEYDEDGGFLHPDGQTFYFASKGPKSIGGYDILYATLNEENKFSNVTNMGYPINTTDDDVFYVTSPDGKRGYFSSATQGGYGEKDLYLITMSETRETFLALFKGQLLPAEGDTLPDNIVIVVTDKESNEIIGSYRPKTQNGTFTTILPPGREYNFSYQTDNNNEEFYNEDVFVSNDLAYQEIQRAVTLEPVRLGSKLRVKKNTIVLNAVVLNNSKHKKAVANAEIIIVEPNGINRKTFASNKEGKQDSIVLQQEKIYLLFATEGKRKSDTVRISTMGIKQAQVMSEVLYLEKAPEKVISKEQLLNVVVKNARTKRAVANASVTIVDADGERQEAVTDAKGKISAVQLSPEMRYEIMAYLDGSVSEKETFSTTAQAKTHNKTLYIAFEQPVVAAPDNDKSMGCSSADYMYQFFFRYGHKIINEADECWVSFIDSVVAASKINPNLTIRINSSASTVPSRRKNGNEILAASRGKNFEQLVRRTLEQRGVDVKKVTFKRTSLVGGPKYQGDVIAGRKKYERHQYVKATLKR